ncbi:MAG: nucleotidyltransferase family protein [Caldilineaceae bacterium]
MAVQVMIPTRELVEFCRRNAIRKLALFGSVLRDDFRPDSDVDVLVEFEPTAHIGWEFIDIQDELARLLAHDVDLHTPFTLSPHFRDEVLQKAQVVYERA